MEGNQPDNINQAARKVVITTAEFGAKYQSKREVSAGATTIDHWSLLGLPLPEHGLHGLHPKLRHRHGLAS